MASKRSILYSVVGGIVFTGVWVAVSSLVSGYISWGPALVGGAVWSVASLVLFSRKQKTDQTDA